MRIVVDGVECLSLYQHFQHVALLVRYMRYATAVYGGQMMRAATWDQGGTGTTQEVIEELWSRASTASLSIESLRNSFTRVISSSSLIKDYGNHIADYVGIPEEDVIYVDNGPVKDKMHHLSHVVALDHNKRSVVLAIRGSFTVADILIDVAGFSRKYIMVPVCCDLYFQCGVSSHLHLQVHIVEVKHIPKFLKWPIEYGKFLVHE
jgi:hypothetical protein